MKATAWVARLSQPSIDGEALRAFFAWKREPANAAAFDAASKARRRQTERFRVEPDATGFSVIDVSTGEPAAFANRPQSGISEADAEAIAEVLNRRDLSSRAAASH
jgi:ferric-dicitrate binding protein FerR (iron transport regulator)